MIKTVIFDTDGMVIKREMRFSERFSVEFGIPVDKIFPFFKNEFKLCLIGRADLKQELKKYLHQWNWPKSADDLLKYWFEHESKIDDRIIASVKKLKDRGIKCYLDTNNEQYRTQYLWDNLSLKDNFDGIFSSSELGSKKPQKEFWQAIHNELGKPVKTSVLIWDNDEENVKSAKRFGFKSEYYFDFDFYENRMKELFG